MRTVQQGGDALMYEYEWKEWHGSSSVVNDAPLRHLNPRDSTTQPVVVQQSAARRTANDLARSAETCSEKATTLPDSNVPASTLGTQRGAGPVISYRVHGMACRMHTYVVRGR
jgi:hypothetical protein